MLWGLVMGCLPYCVAEPRIRRKDGTDEYMAWLGKSQIKRTPWYWMPHFVVSPWLRRKDERRRRKLRTDDKVVGMPKSGYALSVDEMVARLSAERNDALAVRRDARILVVLHFFYPDLWPIVRTYLENLTPYDWDLVVTYPTELIPESELAAIRTFKPSVRLMPCRNAGFDIGPFIEALKGVNLGDHDIVFKLQTKGCGRLQRFIYGQVFRGADWFHNLFDGILGGKTVHKAVSALMSDECALVASENLIVRDPKHKCNYVRKFCAERGWRFVEDYRYVAGTCFAVRSETLRPLKALGLSLSDFGDTVRGQFSLAHALERWMCFAAAGRMKGIPVAHDAHPEETARLLRCTALQLLDDPRFDLDDEFMYRAFEFAQIGGYEVVEIRLGDIRRVWYDMRAYRLNECSPYRYLGGDARAYEDYCKANSRQSFFVMSRARFDALIGSMGEFNPRRMPVVLGKRNVILDGQHRCCILLKRFGPDYRIKVVRVFPKKEKD